MNARSYSEQKNTKKDKITSKQRSISATQMDRRFLLKLTPIEARNLLEHESGKVRNPYCTLVLLDENMNEIKGEKEKTPILKGNDPIWSPLKAEMIRIGDSSTEQLMPLGLETAASAEEYTFGKMVDLSIAKFVLVKCKDKASISDTDLGRLLLSLVDLDTSGTEQVAWYELQLRPGKMKVVKGEIKIASRIIREPSRWQLWSCAQQMMDELDIKDHNFYLKLHRQCFTGKACVEWMLRHGTQRAANGGITIASVEEAILLGQSMMRANIMCHVTGDSKKLFMNSARQFYRFQVHNSDVNAQMASIKEMEEVLSNAVEGEVVPNEMKRAVSTASSTISAVNAAEADNIGNVPGLKIQDFQLLRVLGTGTYGKVVSAKGPNGKVYAIKIVSKIGIDERTRNNTKMERDVLSELAHPFVATLSFAFQNEDKLYMGMPFFNGGDLRHHLGLHAKGELLLLQDRIVYYSAELVAGIAHLHSLNIIYRDLKPENILIAHDGHIKLVDFGLSKISTDQGEKASTFTGSPDYVAPEVLLAASNKESGGYDVSCDWWSLGIVIFEMYVGRTPFKDVNRSIMYRNIVEGDLFIPPDIPETARNLLVALINKDPNSRIGSHEPVPFSIMNHPYFENIQWDDLQRKKIPTPWLPDVINAADAKYIDEEFANQIPMDTPEWRMLDSVDREREHLQGFTFQPQSFATDR